MLFCNSGPPLAVILACVNLHLKFDLFRVVVNNASLMLTILRHIKCYLQVVISSFAIYLSAIRGIHVENQFIVYALSRE